jgi:hypothetical protein
MVTVVNQTAEFIVSYQDTFEYYEHNSFTKCDFEKSLVINDIMVFAHVNWNRSLVYKT